MKQSLSVSASTALSLIAVTGLVIPASASGTVLEPPTLSISGDNVTVSGAVWDLGPEDFILACLSPVTANGTPTDSDAAEQSGPLAGCRYISRNTSGNPPLLLVPSDSLTQAYIFPTGPNGVPYDPDNVANHGRHLLMVSFASETIGGVTTRYAIWSASQLYGGGGGTPPAPAEAAPYTGPVVQSPGISSPKRAGEKLTLSGSNLSGVTKAEIAGLDCQVVVNSAGEIEIVVPAGLAAGTYDLVITSDSGKLTVQDAVVVSGSLAATSGAVAAGSKKTGDSVRIVAMDVVGAGKVQIFFNGKEIAWVNAANSSDPKLRSADGVPYLVRTVDLVPGQKNVVEIYVDGERVRRVAYGN